MLVSAIPGKVQVPFAVSGTQNVIPVTASPNPGLASYTTGFPPLTFTPLSAGGKPPAGGDFNAILFTLSSWAQWQAAGGPVGYDATFSGNIGGYMAGSLISVAGILGAAWLSSIDSNVNNPDTGGSGWTLIKPASWGGLYTSTGSANALVITLSPSPLSAASLAGSTLKIIPNATCTGAATVTINGFTAINVRRSDGAALQNGDIVNGNLIEGVVTTGGTTLQLTTPVSSQIAVTAPLNLAIDTSGAANTITASVAGLTYVQGVTVRVIPANSSTGGTVVANFNTLGNIQVVRPDSTACRPNDIVAATPFNALINVIAGPTTILQMLSWPAGTAPASVSQTGASDTYTIANAGQTIKRSNSGSPMIDTVPGNSSTPLPAGWKTTVINADATALLSIGIANVGAGSTLTGSGAIVGIGAGSYHVMLGPGQSLTLTSDGTNYQCWGAPGRAKFTANVTLNVNASTGSDGATGLTSGNPLQTMQRAYNILQGFADVAGFQATINPVGTGYTTGVNATGPLMGQASPVIINGAGSGTTTIAATGGTACFAANNGSILQPQNMTMTSSGGNGVCLTTSSSNSGGSSTIFVGPGLVFGAAPFAHMLADGDGRIVLSNSYGISGGSTNHWFAEAGGIIDNGNTVITVTLTGTPAFTTFANALAQGLINPAGDVSFSGGATGSRYATSSNGTINTNGQQATPTTNYLPGSTAGTGTGIF